MVDAALAVVVVTVADLSMATVAVMMVAALVPPAHSWLKHTSGFL